MLSSVYRPTVSTREHAFFKITRSLWKNTTRRKIFFNSRNLRARHWYTKKKLWWNITLRTLCNSVLLTITHTTTRSSVSCLPVIYLDIICIQTFLQWALMIMLQHLWNCKECLWETSAVICEISMSGFPTAVSDSSLNTTIYSKNKSQ